VKTIARDRVVVFRLSQQEYQTLKRACDSRGARNLSDFTRTELLSAVPSYPMDDGGDFDLGCLQHQIAALHKNLSHLINLLESFAAGGKTSPAAGASKVSEV